MASYLGNENLKDSNVRVQWTKERLELLRKCKEDPSFFITRYIKVVTLAEGVTAFKLWAFQEKLIDTVHHNRFTICTMPRQSGKSTTMVAYFLHYILFNKHKKVGILANKRDTAIELLSRLQLAFELLPMWLQQGVKVWNKTRIELENGCVVEASATSAKSVRGKTYNIIFLDEFAHIENKLADQFWTSTFPVIASDASGIATKVIIVSTPKGLNLFYELWRDSNLDKSHPKYNRFVPVQVHYTEVPGREKPEWAQEMLAIMGEDRFNQEFGCDFLGSSSTLIAGRFLKLMEKMIQPCLYQQNGLDVWEDPKVDLDEATGVKSPHAYVICVDTARGKQLDYSALTVIDVTDSPYKVVAKYRSNKVPVTVFADQIVPIAKRYNNAHILVEMDGPGYQVADDLHHIHEYENILMVATKGRSGQILATGFGSTGKNVQRCVKMSTPVRRTGCANLKTLIETQKLIVIDKDIIDEFSTFSLKGEATGPTAKYEAEDGKHDDLVMTLVTFSWLTTQKHFRDLMESKIRESLLEDFAPNFEHDLTPYGWVMNGFEEEKPEKDPEIDGGKDLWRRVGDFNPYNDYDEDMERMRSNSRLDMDALERLNSYYGWSR
jgi:hypothetical protein